MTPRLCAFGCGAPVPPPRHRFCSDGCMRAIRKMRDRTTPADRQKAKERREPRRCVDCPRTFRVHPLGRPALRCSACQRRVRLARNGAYYERRRAA